MEGYLYVNKTTVFEKMCFVLVMSDLVPHVSTLLETVPHVHVSTWTLKSNDEMKLRYLQWCFTSPCKIETNALILYDFI